MAFRVSASGMQLPQVASPMEYGLAGLQQGFASGRAQRDDEAAMAALDSVLASRQGGVAPGGVAPMSLGSLGGLGGGMPQAAAAPASAGQAVTSMGNAAPTNVKISGDRKGFIDALMPAAIEASKRTGVDPRIIVAQAAQETGWGKSAPGNNYFGIKSHGKGGGQTFSTHEYVNGKRVNIKDSFRSYESPAHSVMGYAEFLQQNPRYRSFMGAQGMDAQLSALQASGYATDPNYSRSVGAIARSIPLPGGWNEPQAAPVQVASLEPGAGLDTALGQGAVRARGGAFAGPDSDLAPQERARMEALRTPLDSSNVQPYSGTGAQTEASGFRYDEQGFRPNGMPGVMPASSNSPLPQFQPQQVAQSQALPDAETMRALFRSPMTRDFAISIARRAYEGGSPQETYSTFEREDGSVWQINNLNGQLNRVAAGSEGKSGVVVGGRIVDPTTGQVIYQPDPSEAGATEYGLTPQYGVDAQGNPVIIQIGKDGSSTQTPLPEGVSLARDPIRIDAGTETILLDPQTRQRIGAIPKNNRESAAETAAGTVEGRTAAERVADSPRAVQQADQMLASIDGILQDPNLGWATGAWSWTANIPGAPARGTRARMDQLGGQAFLQAFESLKGGGQITEIEGQKATQAIGRLDSAQSEQDYRAALSDLRQVVMDARDRAVRQGGGQPDQRVYGEPIQLDEVTVTPTGLPDGVTEEDIQHTMQVHGVTREQVLERLRNGS